MREGGAQRALARARQPHRHHQERGHGERRAGRGWRRSERDDGGEGGGQGGGGGIGKGVGGGHVGGFHLAAVGGGGSGGNDADGSARRKKDESIQLYSRIESLISESARQSQGADAAGQWEEVEGAWVLRPPAPLQATAVVHFIGGAFVGASPQLTYRLFLTTLAQRGLMVVATPYASGFDHLRIADEAQFRFDRCMRSLSLKAQPPNDPMDLPVYGVGHSMGALVHLLIGARYAVERAGNVFLSFNNKEASAAIPLFSPVIMPMAQSLGPILTQLLNNPTLKLGADVAVKQLRDLNAPMVAQLLPLLEQLPPLYRDLSDGRDQFTPAPAETRRLAQTYYGVRRNLLVRFKDDTIDETADLADTLAAGSAVSACLDLAMRTLPGDHVRPLRQVVPEIPQSVADVVSRGSSLLASMTAGTPLADLARGVPYFDLPERVIRSASDWLATQGSKDLAAVAALLIHVALHDRPPSDHVSISKDAALALLAILLRLRPATLQQVPDALLPPIKDKQRPSSAQQPPTKDGASAGSHVAEGDRLAILAWIYGQAARADRVAGMSLFIHCLLPPALHSDASPACTHLALCFLEEVVLENRRKAYAELHRGAVRGGLRLVPPEALHSFLLAAFPAKGDCTEFTPRFAHAYLIVKQLALVKGTITGDAGDSEAASQASLARAQSSQEAAEKLLPLMFDASREGSEEAREEAGAIVVWCLIENPACYSQWGRLHSGAVDTSRHMLAGVERRWEEVKLQLAPYGPLRAFLHAIRRQ
ncbi:unnamed protein product, partial [Closterium sp. Naga37s-1]